MPRAEIGMEKMCEQFDAIHDTRAGASEVGVFIHGKDSVVANRGISLQPACFKSCRVSSIAFQVSKPHGETISNSGDDVAISDQEILTESAPLRPNASSPPAISTISGSQCPQQ